MNQSPKRATVLRFTASIAFAGLGLLALAASAGAEPPRRGPPPEAFTACEGKARGDACSVQIHDRTMEGVCDSPPDATRLACRPNGPPPGPPPEESDR